MGSAILTSEYLRSVHIHLRANERLTPRLARLILKRKGLAYIEPLLRYGGQEWPLGATRKVRATELARLAADKSGKLLTDIGYQRTTHSREQRMNECSLLDVFCVAEVVASATVPQDVADLMNENRIGLWWIERKHNENFTYGKLYSDKYPLWFSYLMAEARGEAEPVQARRFLLDRLRDAGIKPSAA